MKTLFFTLVIASSLFLPTNTFSQCSSYTANKLVNRYENKILSLLESSGDTNVYTKVIDCDYYSSDDTWVIKHTISFNGIWTGDFYKATGKLIIKPNSWDWKFISGNDNMYAYLILIGLLEEAVKENYSPYGSIKNVWTDHNVYENGKKGMRIHAKVKINNGKYENFEVIAYFHKQNGAQLKGYNGSYEASNNQVCASKKITPSYDSSAWDDVSFFLPYTELELSGSTKTELYFQVQVYKKDGWKLLDSYKNFYITYG